MIDSRFSAESFTAAGLDTPAAQELADLLAVETLKELQSVVELPLRHIIERLNQMGHNLTLEKPAADGDISYKDDCEEDSGYHCKLRLGVDIVVSTGYAHLSSGNEFFEIKEDNAKNL